MIEGFALPYTIGFLVADGKVLMQQRVKEPNLGKWNGLGGKIKEGETPEQAVLREVEEESGIALPQGAIRFVGVVTWTSSNVANNNRGMYAYVASFSEDNVWDGIRETPEGKLGWHPVAWATNVMNRDVVENIPYFLPRMLALLSPVHYHCDYVGNTFAKFTINPLEEPTLDR